MSTPLSLLARKSRLSGILAGVGLNGGAKLTYYTNSPPALPDDAPAQTALCVMPLSSPAGVVSDAAGLATLTFTVPVLQPAALTGLIGWARLSDGAGNGYIDLPAGVVGSGMPIILNTLQVFANGEVQLLSFLATD